MADDKPKRLPLSEIRTENGAHELATSPDMRPYFDLIVASLRHQDTGGQLLRIAQLPLERRYTWRVLSALKLAFADLDTMNVDADVRTLREEDYMQICKLIKRRPTQFCLFLKALLGEEAMVRLMAEAVAEAQKIG